MAVVGRAGVWVESDPLLAYGGAALPAYKMCTVGRALDWVTTEVWAQERETI